VLRAKRFFVFLVKKGEMSNGRTLKKSPQDELGIAGKHYRCLLL